ncbi:MAG: hypothetical protein H5U16_04345 [Roseovarius sp.]|nr:hypothetical protein [Roseovarius sp.]
MRRAFVLVSLCLLAGCTDPYPRADPDAVDKAAPYPELVPAEAIRAGVPAPRATPEAEEALAARAERLHARAGALRRPVIEPADRARMEAGVAD